MLQLRIEDREFFNEETQQFFTIKGQTLQLEHSLVSMSKWEAKYKKYFLSRDEKTMEETLDYIRFMTITQNVNPDIYKFISPEQIRQVNDYIDDPMTATNIKKQEGKGGGAGKAVSTEEIYYYMAAYQIPFDPCQKWHFNRLMALIRICDEKNKPGKKMSKGEIVRNNRALNNKRKARLHTRG